MTSVTRRGFNAGLFASTGLLLLSGASHSRAETPVRGGTLTLLLDPEPSRLVSWSTTGGPEYAVSAKVTEGLLSHDFDLTPRPQLATAWSISEDGLRYTFTLRDGVKWHDGKPFTSADVAYSLPLLKERHPRGRFYLAQLVEVQTPDPLTAVVVLAKPAPYLLTALSAAEAPIVPKHIYDGSDPAENPANGSPIGTGPFIFKEWVKGSHIIYDRNPEYWDAPKPYVDRLIIRFVPDAAARVAALESGEVDVSASVPLSEIERLRQNENLIIEERGNEYLPVVVRAEFNLDHPILKNIEVRKAIAHGVDRERILNIAYYGYGAPAPSPVSPKLAKFYNPDVEAFPFDPELANSLLEKAGFAKGADGFRFRLNHDYFPFGDGPRRVGEIIKDQLAKIGIAVELRSQDYASWVKRVYTDRDFDFTNYYMGNSFDPSVGLTRYFSSKGILKGVPFTNASHFSDPDVDRLLDAASVEIDPPARKTLLDEFQVAATAGLPGINLFAINFQTVVSRRLADVITDAAGLNGNLADVYIRA